MSDVSTTQGVLFTGLFDKPLMVEFDQARSSTDGGAILLKACDERLRLSTAMAACLVDKRQAGKINHTLTELFRQRLFGIACGYRAFLTLCLDRGLSGWIVMVCDSRGHEIGCDFVSASVEPQILRCFLTILLSLPAGVRTGSSRAAGWVGFDLGSIRCAVAGRASGGQRQ